MVQETENQVPEQQTEEPSRADIIKAGRDAGWFDNKKERDSHGRFTQTTKDAPKEPDERQQIADKGAKPDKVAEKPKPEPFEGFSSLPEAAQQQFNRLIGERNQFKNQYASILGQQTQIRRELDNLKRQQQAPQTPKQQQEVAKSLKKFEDFKQRYPEDAEAIQEMIDSVRNEFSQPTQGLLQEVERLKGTVEGFQAEKQRMHAERVQDQLSREHPSWRQIAGWEDEQGNPIEGNREWHPWFTAWKNGLPPEIAADYDQKLGSVNATLIGHVLNHFERDVQSILDNSGQQQTDEQPSRRDEQLRDISPRPSRAGAEPQPTNPFIRQNGADRSAVLSSYLEQWRTGQKQMR